MRWRPIAFRRRSKYCRRPLPPRLAARHIKFQGNIMKCSIRVILRRHAAMLSAAAALSYRKTANQCMFQYFETARFNITAISIFLTIHAVSHTDYAAWRATSAALLAINGVILLVDIAAILFFITRHLSNISFAAFCSGKCEVTVSVK